MVIDFSGTAGQVQRAFHTEIHHLDVKGEKHIANISNPQIPAALGSLVVGIVSLHD
jgi:subtilase family serine protease